jgi:hypothetical protein
MIPSSEQASDPTASFFAGIPKRRTAGIPRRRTSLTSFTRFSTLTWKTPGIEGISFRTFFPAAAKRG